MANLLYAYEARRTLENARRIFTYDRKHPMASCMLTTRELGILADAIVTAKAGS